jgi:OOP family OmpA-OmpF porin
MPTRIAVFVALLVVPIGSVADECAMPEHYAWLGTHLSQYWPYHEEIAPDFVEEITLPGLQAGYRTPYDWSVQATWERNDARDGRGRNLRVHNSRVSVRHHVTGNSWEPYAGLNAGKLVFETRADRESETMLGLEAGVQTRVQPHWILDLGARVPNSLDNERFDLQAWIGLNHVFEIGGKSREEKRTPAPVQPEAEPANDSRSLRDSDRDGVPDPDDACPDTPAGRAVDERGCIPAQ